jgi:hypothetical protein
MKTGGRDLVVAALREPASLAGLSDAGWDLLVRQARSAGLLARVGELVHGAGWQARVPGGVQAHLEAARILAFAHHDEMRREVKHIVKALAPLSVRMVLLKGTAYLLAGLPAAAGRTFSDVDILVPRQRLDDVERALLLSGWASTHHSPYDQRYYRKWMHELPPLQHIRRQTVLDVHHAILPDTARRRPDSTKLLAAALALPGMPGVHVFAPADMVLHCIAHLFHNDDMRRGLRDLSDLDRLLRHFGATAGFWDTLLARGGELDLERPLHYGLQCAHLILGTPVPAPVLDAAAGAAPGRMLRSLMGALWQRVLAAPHGSVRLPTTPAAHFMLYVRAHWLRMPPGLLLRHLAVKAWGRRADMPTQV